MSIKPKESTPWGGYVRFAPFATPRTEHQLTPPHDGTTSTNAGACENFLYCYQVELESTVQPIGLPA